MLALKISHGKWILLTNEENMKSPIGFSMSGSFCQANPTSVTKRVKVKMFSLVSGLLSAGGRKLREGLFYYTTRPLWP